LTFQFLKKGKAQNTLYFDNEAKNMI